MKTLQGFEQTRHLLVVDALRYTLLIENQAYSAMRRAMSRVENAGANSKHPSHNSVVTIFRSAWETVDSIRRVRGLANQVYGLSQNRGEIKGFYEKTKSVENFRNIYQHLNSDLQKVVGKTSPVLGAVSWVTRDPLKSITTMLGTMNPEIQTHSLTLDREKWELIPKIQLQVRDLDLDLFSAHQAARKLQVFIERWLNESGRLSEKTSHASVIRFNIG